MTTTVLYPEGVQSQGNVKVKAVFTLANSAAPTVAEVNASSAVDLSLFLYPGGWSPTITTNKGTKPPRLASKVSLESFNRSAYGLPDLLYAFDPQGAPGDADNAAYEALTPGLSIYLVERLGVDAEGVAFTSADYVRVHHVTLGEQFPVYDTTDENDEVKIQQSVIYVTPPGARVKLV